MEHQPGFSELEFAGRRKTTRREKFLAEMEITVPWDELLVEIKPYYPNGKRGGPPIGLARMFRLYFLQQWYFGMKAHIGTDRDSGIVHTVISTAANISDISQTDKLLHGQETQVHADAGYTGVEKREETAVEDPTGRIDWQIAKRRSPIKKME